MPLLSALLITPCIAVGPEMEITGKNYIVYTPKSEKGTNLDSILNQMQNYDIILFGEEQSDSVAHYMQLSLLKEMYTRFGHTAGLSMEIFNMDVHTKLDEYLAGNSKEIRRHKRKGMELFSAESTGGWRLCLSAPLMEIITKAHRC